MAEIDWDDAYQNMAYVPDGALYPDRWAKAASAYRAAGGAMELDVPYGSEARQKLDIFLPDDTPKGLAVFVHGGYWLKFDKSYWSHLAEGARSQGWAVAMPSYRLAPEARIADMVADVGLALDALAQQFSGAIHLAGHSAGGHLAARMACRDAPLKQATRARVSRVLSISGLHDLAPLMKTSMNETLGIDEAEARAQSPALLHPRDGVEVISWVGEEERPEFLRQSALLKTAWEEKGVSVAMTVATQRHHFDVIAPLTDGASALTQAWIGH